MFVKDIKKEFYYGKHYLATYAEATEWAEKHLDGDEYEQIFGAVVEDESKKTAAYSLSVTAIEVLRRMAQEQGKSASEILDAMILAAK